MTRQPTREEMEKEIRDMTATITRIRQELDFCAPANQAKIRASIAKDLDDGMSLRTIAHRYGVGVGVVRGIAKVRANAV